MFSLQDHILSQLSQEEATRERLLHWDQQLARVTTVAEEVGGARMIGFAGCLAGRVLGAVRSPLGGSYCRRIWTLLADGVIEEWALGECVHIYYVWRCVHTQ